MTSRKHCLVKHTDVSGCQMFPVPSMADILMDLYCENVPFHQGHAHQGMAAACSNILAMVDIYTIYTIYTIYINYDASYPVQLLLIRIQNEKQSAFSC